MAAEELQILRKLLNPLPQYVLGCFPAIAIIGESPMSKFTEKFTWVLRCLGCPFSGLFYSLNVGNKEVSRCIYWLSVDYFKVKKDMEISYQKPQYRPFAKASVLERLSSLVSAYYIVVGVTAGISMTTGPIVCEGWAYIPLLLSWTFPAIWKRGFSGILVVKDPKKVFENTKIYLDGYSTDEIRTSKRATVTMTALLSIVYPWITACLPGITNGG
ncbi:2987_t:CDS:2 [Funneliformis geosporum]|uniref:2987_t:CDS:1 n=1 Tax=Funneliformis geosporum TaxID=1117311 RepID=A0A9W4SLN3_9GLOM|nr:2987_t:CDS:2 [Funneliformis geosporum]